MEAPPAPPVPASPNPGQAFVDAFFDEGLASGGTWFRVQALRATTLGKVVVAQTEVAFVEVP